MQTYKRPAIVSYATKSRHAEDLLRFVEACFAVQKRPENRTAQLVLRLLENEKQDRCPCCKTKLDLRGFSSTKTAYSRRQSLRCLGCFNEFILVEEHIA